MTEIPPTEDLVKWEARYTAKRLLGFDDSHPMPRQRSQFKSYVVVISGAIRRTIARAALSSSAPQGDYELAPKGWRDTVQRFIHLAEMGYEESLKEPEENGNFAAYEAMKRLVAAPVPSAPPADKLVRVVRALTEIAESVAIRFTQMGYEADAHRLNGAASVVREALADRRLARPNSSELVIGPFVIDGDNGEPLCDLYIRDEANELIGARLVARDVPKVWAERIVAAVSAQPSDCCKRTLERAAEIFDLEAEQHALGALWIGPDRERWRGVPPKGKDARPMNGQASAYQAAIGRAAAIRNLSTKE